MEFMPQVILTGDKTRAENLNPKSPLLKAQRMLLVTRELVRRPQELDGL